MANGGLKGGTGAKLGAIVIILTGVCALVSILISLLSIWLQTKNYRKPLLQRYVIRILFLVPFFVTASWASLVSLEASQWIEPFRDIYEAFTIYAFFQLLINFIGGERALIILMHGRAPIHHIWPLNYCLSKVDISDPHTFLAIKRGILQYTWIKPLLAIATIVMKATGTYQNGYIGLSSGYLWSGLIYNVSISVSLYALAMFWICMSADLQPFRPMPKFLCIKGIIFASYWQGFMLSILVKLGAITNKVPGYTPDNLAAAIQDALICFEMPLFTILQWYAFSWKDYADVTISAARMPVKYAFRDATGVVDLIQDAKDTFAGHQYEYRYFDATDDTLAHEESHQRVSRMMEGMRYERGGKGKYWIPKPGQADNRTPLLNPNAVSDDNRSSSHSRTRQQGNGKYGTNSDETFEELGLNEDDERLYANARALEFGDWNYPVILAHHATREDIMYADPRIVTSSTSRHVLHPTKANRARRKDQIKDIQDAADQGKHRKPSSSHGQSKSKGILPNLLHRNPSQESSKSDQSQLVDLVIEDTDAEDVERVRARKEGSPEWNKHEPKHFVHTYPEDEQDEEVREGFEPTAENKEAKQLHATGASFEVGSDGEEDNDAPGEASHWKNRNYTEDENDSSSKKIVYDDNDESNVWNSPKK